MLLRSVIVGILLLATQGGGADAHTTRHSPVLASSSTGWNDWTRSSTETSTHQHHRRRASTHLHTRGVRSGHHTIPVLPSGSGDLATVPTAAGLTITVEKKLVNQFQGFVADLVKLGYTPNHIGCWAPVGTHVANSNHYHGGACDFDQTGWGRTNPTMYHVHDLVAKWGLRDGCSFRRPDCGHVDDGTNIGWKHPNNLIARYVDYQTTPVAQVRILDNFEE